MTHKHHGLGLVAQAVEEKKETSVEEVANAQMEKTSTPKT